MSLAQDMTRQNAVMELARYIAVVVVGLGVDVGIGYAGHQLLALPLVVSAALGFLAGIAVNYVLFELWLFRTGRLSWARLGKAWLAAQGALLVRLGAVWALSRLLAGVVPGLPRMALVVLILAAGLSFVVNFVLVRLMLKPGPKG